MSHVTIVETDPDPANPGGPDAVIDAIVTALPHPVHRAGFVGELGSVMAAHPPAPSPPPPLGQKPKPRIIQIIGHGRPGQVSIGETYTGRYATSDFKRYFSLDSNPINYGALFGAVTQDMEVWIIGCSAGETPPESQGFSVNGPTLLFDLAQMWNCTVRASTGLVDKTDFDASGLFRHPDRLLSVEKVSPPPGPPPPLPERYAWRVTWPPPVAALPDGAPATHRVELLTLQQVPIARLSAPRFNPIDLSTGARNALGKAYRNRLIPDLGPILATPEYVFDARLQGVAGRAEILLNAKLLRFRAGNEIKDFVTTPFDVDPHQRVDPHHELNKLLRAGLPI